MTASELRFDGDVIVVTGAARGLGAAYASYLSSVGARVVTNDIDDPADVKADVSTEAGALAVASSALAQFGRIDAVIANAGVSWHRPFAELTATEFDDCMRHNLSSTFHTVKAVWNHMTAQNYGRIVLTASGAVFGFAGRAHYAAAKGGVLALTRTLAIEGKPAGVLVNCVLPWGITRLARPGSAAPPPDEAAPAVAQLCARSWTSTGDAYYVGGGRFDRVKPP